MKCFPSTLLQEAPRTLLLATWWLEVQSSPALQSTRRPGPQPVRARVVPEGKMGKGCLEARAGRSREPDGELALQAVLVFQGLESRKESSGTR